MVEITKPVQSEPESVDNSESDHREFCVNPEGTDGISLIS